MHSKAESIKGTLAILLASILWGTTGTAAHYAPNIGPLAIGAFAMGGGGILLLLTASKKVKADYQKIISQPLTLALGAASVAIYPLAFYSSMRLSGVAIGTVVSIATAPFFAAILERVISKKQISKQWILSFAIGAIGIALLSMGKVNAPSAASTAPTQHLGILLGCLAGFTYASYSWSAKQMIDIGVRSHSAMATLFGLAAIVLLPSLYFTGGELFSSVSNASVSLYMAIVPMFIGYLLFSYGLKTTDASKATLITLIEPLLATLLAVVLVGEAFNHIGWVGACMVSMCLLLQTFSFSAVRNRLLART